MRQVLRGLGAAMVGAFGHASSAPSASSKEQGTTGAEREFEVGGKERGKDRDRKGQPHDVIPLSTMI